MVAGVKELRQVHLQRLQLYQGMRLRTTSAVDRWYSSVADLAATHCHGNRRRCILDLQNWQQQKSIQQLNGGGLVAR
jgi:hypothetical protein